MDQFAWIQNWRFTRLCDTVSSRLCLWDIWTPADTWRLYSVASTSMQCHDVASTLRRRCINVMCPLGSSLPTPCQMSYSLPNTMFKETTTIDQIAWQIQFLRRAEMTGKLEPQHVKTYNRIFAPNENSNQPAHRAVWSESSFSAWRNFASLAFQNAPSEDSDQTARKRRLIWIFAERTCQKVRFLTLRLICSLEAGS